MGFKKKYKKYKFEKCYEGNLRLIWWLRIVIVFISLLILLVCLVSEV